MDKSNLPARPTPHFDVYRKDCFDLAKKEEHPLFNTDPEQLEILAKEKLSQGGWYYAHSNAGESHTHRSNRESFYRWKIVPRMLVDTNARDTTVELFGHKLDAPILFAPVGINKIYHPRGELNAATVAKELNLGYCLSTAASQSIEDVAKANGEGVRFFQLYLPPDEEIEDSLLKRALDNGFTACIWTVDTWQLGWRHDDVANSNYAFYKGIGAELGWSDPVFQKRMAAKGMSKETHPKETGEMWIDTSVWHGRAFSWDKAEQLCKKWKAMSGGKPFLIKGIQHPADAKKAIDIVCDGIVVSNHAGRQVDGAIASLDALPEIVEAIGDKGTIIFDSGIRGGADVFKALALGAKAVLIGRLWIYGMSIAGETGVRHVMKSLLADFDLTMQMAGTNSIKDINKDMLKFLPYGSSGSGAGGFV